MKSIIKNLFVISGLFLVILIIGAGSTYGQNANILNLGGISFTLKECRYAGGLIKCYFDVRSHGRDRRVEYPFLVSGATWSITDNLANTFTVNDYFIGNKRGLDTTLVADLSYPLIVSSEFRGTASSISLLNLSLETEGKVWRYVFRGVPVVDDSPKELIKKAHAVHNGVTIAFESCNALSLRLTCTFTAVNSNNEVWIEYPSSCFGCTPRAVDNLGNEYSMEKAIFGNAETRKLEPNSTTRVTIIVNQFRADATGLALLEIQFQDVMMKFRNLSIGEELAYASPTNNVALGKRVFIETNGTDDYRKDCSNPQEITDGKLRGGEEDCAPDNVVGFQNWDYKELMEVTVKIDLKQTYDISKIRYNQGDVRRAETWNADMMISPFGRTRTIPGISKRGAWTEHHGKLATSIVEIKFQKVRSDYTSDWLYIGEIEVIGTPVISTDTRPTLAKRDPEPGAPRITAGLLKNIEEALKAKGLDFVEIEVTADLLVINGAVPKGRVDEASIIVNRIARRNVVSKLAECESGQRPGRVTVGGNPIFLCSK